MVGVALTAQCMQAGLDVGSTCSEARLRDSTFNKAILIAEGLYMYIICYEFVCATTAAAYTCGRHELEGVFLQLVPHHVAVAVAARGVRQGLQHC